MHASLNRRTVLASGAAALGTFLLDPASAAHAQGGATADAPALDERYPTQEEEAVKAVVSFSHFSLEKVRELVDPRPELANAAWDWGFGDWESALGAASHTANREIVRYLIAQGARPDLFTAAMLGQLEVVRGLIAALPGIQSRPGPHGITLRRHAELGGEPAQAVLAYLDQLGDADVQATDLPLPIEKEQYVGRYSFGGGKLDHFEVSIGRRGNLMLQRVEGTPRTIFHQGEHAFHPAGAPSARLHFRVEDGRVRSLEVRNPELIVTAVRAAS